MVCSGVTAATFRNPPSRGASSRVCMIVNISVQQPNVKAAEVEWRASSKRAQVRRHARKARPGSGRGVLTKSHATCTL